MQKQLWKRRFGKVNYGAIRFSLIQYSAFLFFLSGLSVTVHTASALPMSDTTLANGLRVIVISKHTAPVVSITVAYRVGSKDESHTHTGFAHFFEHLMFEGSLHVPHGDFDRYCSEAGGTNNAYTNHDKTVYYMELPSHQLELGLWLESDRMLAFGVSPQSVDIQKNVVTEEINQNVENRPYGDFSLVQNSLAFSPQCTYSWDVYGSKQHIASSMYEDVKHFYETFYRPDNACIVICGDVSTERAITLVKKYFGEIPHAPTPIKRTTFNPSYRQNDQYRRLEEDIPMEGVFLSYHCDGFTSKEQFTAEVLSSILSDGMSSRLYRNMVYQQQIASDINAYVDDREWSSLFVVYAIGNTEKNTCEELNRAIGNILNEIIEKGVTAQEVMKAQNRLRTRIARNFQHVSNIGDEVAHNTLFFNHPERTFELMDFIAAVTPEMVQELAKKIFRQQNQIRIDYLPKKGRKQ